MSNVSNPSRDDPTEPSDEDLVRAILADPGSSCSRETASALFGRYRKRVYVWCHRYVRDHEKALDLAQDVLLSAYRTLGTFQERSRFSSWLYAITRNRCFNELRRPAIFVHEEIDMDQMIDPGADQADRLIQALDEEAVLQLIHEHLDPQEQEVIWLRCFERMPIDMITETLRIRQASGARGVLQRARRALRAALEARGDAVGTER
jgi:RNA polymerase sigma factor (sigma-70 family)